MSFILNEEQQMLQDQVRSLLAERATPDRLRKLITAKAPWDQELWTALAELGVLGAGLPEEYGGVGLGPVEVGVIAQELGRVTAPVPFFSSICFAAEAILLAGSEAQKQKWLPKLASGEVVATFAWSEGPARPSFKDLAVTLEAGKLNGRKTPVSDAEIAQVCVVAAKSGGKLTLALVELDQPGVARTPLAGLDELRHFAELTFRDAAAEPMTGMGGEEALQQVWDRAAIYEAFEQVGGAEASLYMVRDYTLQRYVFARQLASYQAVKHTLADMLAKTELAQCNALYAAQALGDGQPDLRAAAATARIGASNAYEFAARENLQFHGGIGFTWEANCHFHYRRARTLALNIGSVQVWSDRLIAALEQQKPAAAPTAKAAAAPTREDTPEEADYRARARAWLAENAPAFVVGPDDIYGPRSKDWTREKWQAGYSGIEYPKAAGGQGGTKRQAEIFAEEERAYRVPRGTAHHLAMAAYQNYGTPEQIERWGTVMHSGAGLWTQLFSEPAAGSDLAALRTKAVKQGDKWIINGQKIWSSGAHRADYGFMIARTDSKVPKHKGLSFFFIDIRQPGVTVRPIRQMTGDSEFNEVFFVDAVVPDTDRIGAEGQGWAVAMTVLAAERVGAGTAGFGDPKESPIATPSLLRAAKAARTETGTMLDDGAVRAKLASFHVDEQGVKNFAARMQQQVANGRAPETMPVMKLTSSIRNQLAFAFLQDMEEACGIVRAADRPADEDKFYDYLYSPIWRIAGGAEQVLRNQLSERALGMPGDVRADKDVPFDQLPA